MEQFVAYLCFENCQFGYWV